MNELSSVLGATGRPNDRRRCVSGTTPPS